MPTPRINKETQNGLYFLTITVVEWIDIFTKPEYFNVIIDSLSFCRIHKGLLLYEYVIMTNHLHLIAQAKDGNQLSQIISDFKKHTTHEILKLLANDNRQFIRNLIKYSFYKKKDSIYQIWQRENYPEYIESGKFLNQKINYTQMNPVVKRYVEKPEDWIYSSARNRILGDNSIIELDSFYY